MSAVAYHADEKALLEARESLARIFAEEIAVARGVTVADILGRSKVPVVALARHELMARLWQFGLSLTDIGKALGMDHTSILHGVRRVLGERYRVLSPGQGRTR